MTMLVTGASGFVGSAVTRAALARGCDVRPVYRTNIPNNDDVAEAGSSVSIQRFDRHTDWQTALNGVDIVIHCAARLPRGNETNLDAWLEYREVNVEATLNLARQASLCGVSRFVFISSIKVNGEVTPPGTPFTAEDTPSPKDLYGKSKGQAEVGLWQICQESDMQICIIRPPLVYGSGVKGNFSTLLRCIQYGLPLPLGAVRDNQRSFVNLDNLVDLILVCATHPNAANQTFLVSDGEDLSTAELMIRMARALGRSERLLPIPVGVLRRMARILKKEEFSSRLLDSLQVDITKTKTLINWAPRVSVDDGLSKLADEL